MSEQKRRKIEQDREELPKDLVKFLRACWHVLEPSTRYIHGWHIDAIAEHLTAVKRGEIHNLVINMPPRHMKSILVSVVFPVWMWIDEPYKQFLCASYASPLAIRDSLKARRLITSQWFQERWGDVFALTGDQNAKTRYENSRNGHRIATSVTGSGTGEGGDIEIADDPLNALEAQSDVARQTAIEWWDQTMSTRLNDPKTGARIIVMQRLHEDDLTGHVLRTGLYDHLCLPAEYESKRPPTSIGWQDPRTERGELLCPERFGVKELAKLKLDLGSYGSAGQLQQRPAPAEGGIVKGEWFKLWPADKPLPDIEYLVQSYDTAFTKNTENDPTAQSVWGVFKDDKLGWGVLLMDCWCEHLEYPELRRKAKKEFYEVYGQNEKAVDVALIEEKGSGIVLIQDLERAGISVRKYNPGRDDKVMRLHAVSHLIEGGKVWIPESTKRKNDFCDWAWPLIQQITTFPNASHDDYVDTVTQLLALLRDQQWLFIESDIPEEDEYVPEERMQVNPYGA